MILFHRNPGLIDTVDGVAKRIGRTASGVESDIKELVKLGILKQKKIGTLEVILLDRVRDKQVLSTVADQLRDKGRASEN